MTWISSWPVAFALVGVALLLVLVAVLRARSRTVEHPGAHHANEPPPRKRRTWFVWLASALCLVLGLAVAANAYVGYLPDTQALLRKLGLDKGDSNAVAPHTAAPTNSAGPTKGAAESVVSKIRTPPPTGVGASGAVQVPTLDNLNMPKPTADTWVYVPPGFDTSGRTRYPVLYLFHGSPGSAVDWFNSGVPDDMDQLISTGKLRPAIVVSVDVNGVGVGDTDCLDSDHGGSQVETYIEKVVVPWVDAGYPVADDRRYRAIGGMSSGGYCAMDQGLRHPDLYGTILGIMAYSEPGDEQVSSATARAKYDVLDYLPTMAFPHPVNTFMSYGSTDSEVVKPSKAMAAALQARGQQVDVVVQPHADHTWNTAGDALPPGLEYWEKSMQQLEAAGG